MQLADAASRLLSVLDPEGVLIGGVCGALYGLERFTRGVDVAALCLIHPELEGFCRESASAHGCLEKFESWLNDRRLRQRYSPKEE